MNFMFHLRANQAVTLEELDRHGYCGDRFLVGHCHHAWQDVKTVLGLFGKRPPAARMAYRVFVEEGCEFQAVARRVGDIFGFGLEVALSVGKQPERVGARSGACY